MGYRSLPEAGTDVCTRKYFIFTPKLKMKFDMKLPSCRLCGIGLMVAKFLLILVSLYFFVCSLTFLSDSFRLLGGKNIGAFFANSELLNNPVVGVMIGVLVTVLVQSSSTSTTIIVGLVATDVPVRLVCCQLQEK